MKFNASPLDILNSRMKLKIVKFLLSHEATMSEREIASILKVSHMSINRTMRELSNINFVNFTTVGKVHLWKVNRKSYAFKILSEFIKGISSIRKPMEDLKKIILKNLPRELTKKVILFGSIAKEEEKINSDIDIFILVKNSQNKKKIESFVNKLSNICLNVYGNRLAPYILTEQEIKQKRKAKIISEVNKGLLLYP